MTTSNREPPPGVRGTDYSSFAGPYLPAVRTGVKAGPGTGGFAFNHSEAAKVRPAVQVRTGVKAGCTNCGIMFNHSEAPKVRTGVKAGPGSGNGILFNHSEAPRSAPACAGPGSGSGIFFNHSKGLQDLTGVKAGARRRQHHVQPQRSPKVRISG